jgi:CheY-like chemotaxis protein
MTLSLSDLVRSLFFNGSRKNGNSSGFSHEKESAARESYRSAKIVLFVDDEPSILSMRRLVFEALGYSVLTATCGEDALEIFAMRKVRSDIPIILSSGCLTVPERVLGVVTVAVEKAARPEALIEVLEQHFHPLVESTLDGDREAWPIRY